MGYNSQHKLKNNIAAIRIALEWKQRQLLLPEQVEASIQIFSLYFAAFIFLFLFCIKAKKKIETNNSADWICGLNNLS